MSDRSAIVYRYDGTYPGFLCCVAQCFKDKRLPAQIQLLDEPQETLLPLRVIATDPAVANRIERWVRESISLQVWQMLRQGFLSCDEKKELKLTRFLLLGHKYGDKVRFLSANDTVHEMDQALRYLNNEANRYIEFLRFSDVGGFLAAQIAPHNSVLPLIAPHFCDRFPAENLMIFDKTHHLGFLHRPGGKGEFFEARSIDLPEPDETEAAYRALWKRFYDSIAIEGRLNPKLRQTHMPKRYWAEMTEMQESVSAAGSMIHSLR